MAAQSSDGEEVVRTLLSPEPPPGGGPAMLYAKHMAKQRAGLSRQVLLRGRHFLLVRSPEEVIRSFSEVLSEATLQESCYTALLELYSELRSLKG